MINALWAFMVLFGIAWGSVQGLSLAEAMAENAISSTKEAVTLGITMLGVVGMWNGIMEIAKESKLLDKWLICFNPVISFLFPEIPKNHPVRGHIAMNIVANILGLGWASTPAGLNAMKGLATLNENDKRAATNSMCTLLVINISSLQLIPVNIIAYRSEYLSPHPTEIVGPAIIATTISTIVAIIVCKLFSRRKFH